MSARDCRAHIECRPLVNINIRKLYPRQPDRTQLELSRLLCLHPRQSLQRGSRVNATCHRLVHGNPGSSNELLQAFITLICTLTLDAVLFRVVFYVSLLHISLDQHSSPRRSLALRSLAISWIYLLFIHTLLPPSLRSLPLLPSWLVSTPS